MTATRLVNMQPNQDLPVVAIYSNDTDILLQEWKKRASWIPYRVVLPVTEESKKDDVLKSLQKAEIILSDLDILVPIFDKLPNTKWVQNTWAGIDKITTDVDPRYLPPNFTFTRFGHGFGIAMAEYAIGSIIAHERHFVEYWKRAPKAVVWCPRVYRPLSQLTLGIIGVGDIGKEVARICKSFGMTVWGLVKRDLPMEERSTDVDVYKKMSGLAELLAESDYIVNILPKTPETDDLLSGDVLSSCAKKPVFINIGRGNIICEDDVLKALERGWISHAILDVFKTEPLHESSLLWSSPQVTITPHCAALSRCAANNMIELMLENYTLYINGEKLKYEVDWEQGY